MNTLAAIFDQKPPFLRIQSEGFRLQEELLPELRFRIHDFTCLRKLFAAGRVQCYSLNATTAPDGKQCCLCAWNYTCNRILRLMIMIENTPTPTPAILDVNELSFPDIQPILDQLPPNRTHDTLISATIERRNKRTLIRFQII